MVKHHFGETMTDERQAIVACKAGNTENFRFIVDKYKTRAYQAAYYYTGNREDALDISQEAFYRAFRSIKRFDITKNFYTWFYKILKNLCINFIHSKKSRRIYYENSNKNTFTSEITSSDDNPQVQLEKKERSQLLKKALDELKNKDKDIIILKDFQDLSYAEIAEVLNIPAGSVMSRLYYARKKLVKKLEFLNE